MAVKSVESHPSMMEADRLRRRSGLMGRKFLLVLWLSLFSIVAVYLCAHKLYRAESTLWAPWQLINLDEGGKLTQLSEADLRWYLGRDQTTALVAVLKQRSQQIAELEDKVLRQSLFEFRIRFGQARISRQGSSNVVEAIAAKAAAGDFREASRLFVNFIGGWSEETRKVVGERSLFELGYGFSEMARLKDEQLSAINPRNLQPPLIHQIFWMSPRKALLEAMFWSIFGTLTNMILNVAQAQARGNFRSEEIWVSVSKFFYGPVLSFVLILAIYFGLLDAKAEVRFWFLPLAAFLFGYNVRKTALFIDRLSEKVLGAPNEPTKDGGDWQGTAAYHAATVLRGQARPRSLAELRKMVPMVTESAIVASVLKGK